MPADFGIVYPLWNHADDCESLLERAHGEIGLDHVTVPVITGPRTQFSLFSGRPTPYFHTEGGWHFPVQASRYAATGLTPRAARWFGKRDPVARVRETADRLGLRFVARINPLHALRMAGNAGAVLTRNAWGDVYEDACPCVNQPAARGLVEAAIDDVLRFSPDGIELMGIDLDEIALDFEMLVSVCGLRAVMEICFCAGCRQVAASSVDVDAAERSVRATAESESQSALHGIDECDLEVALRGDSVLTEYRRARVQSVDRWLESITARRNIPRALFDMSWRHSLAIGSNGLDGWLRMGVPTIDLDENTEVEPGEEWKSADCGGSSDDHIDENTSIDAANICVRLFEADELVRIARESVKAGAEFVNFEDVECVPPAGIDAVKQAVRFSRRELSD